MRVLGIDGVYPKLCGQEQPVALGALNEKDWRAVVAWLQPLVQDLGVEVWVSDDLKELVVAACRLELEHQVCQFHVLRWVWRALADLRKQLPDEHHPLVDEVWQLTKERPPEGRVRLYALWRGIDRRRRCIACAC